MAQKQHTKDWNEELDDVRAKLAQAKLAEQRAQSGLDEARLNLDRADSGQRRAGSMASDAEGRAKFAQLKLEEARQNSSNARRKGLPRHRWEADMRRWEAIAEETGGEVRRWNDDGNRQEKELKAFTKEIKDWQSAIVRRAAEVVELDRQFKQRNALGRGLTAAGARTNSKGPARPLAVTQDAMAALSEVLRDLPHRKNQALRLNEAADGSIVLVVDAKKAGDSVVEYNGAPVLLVGEPVQERYRGRVLKLSESPERTQIVLSG